jgi:OmpA-OmpF porin, OOP family
MRQHAALQVIAVLAACMALPATGFAQSSPSAEQIVKSLTPTSTHGATRGIRVGSVPPAAIKPAATAAPAVSLMVQFATGSADLTPQAVGVLDQLGRALSDQSLASYRFRIEGHTDTVGSRDQNQALSDRRAATVVDYLAEKFHVDRSRVQAVGMGEDGLLIPTGDQTPEPRNRRVQVVNIGS